MRPSSARSLRLAPGAAIDPRTAARRTAESADPDAVPPVAARQAGVFTAAQAVTAGWTPRQVTRRRTAGRWRQVLGSGLTATPGPPSAFARAWAVALTWPEAVVEGPTAAVLWSLPVHDDGGCHVVARHGRHTRGVRVRIVLPPSTDVVAMAGGLRVTSRRRTVLDLLARLPTDQGLDLYAWATTRRVVTRDDVLAERRARFGRYGAGPLGRLLDLTSTGAVSGGEHRLHEVLGAAGVTGWQAGAVVEDDDGLIGVVDLLFARERLVVEVDGERAHAGRTTFVEDRRRQNRIVNAGYRILRFTWWDLEESPDTVVRQIRAALAGGY